MPLGGRRRRQCSAASWESPSGRDGEDSPLTETEEIGAGLTGTRAILAGSKLRRFALRDSARSGKTFCGGGRYGCWVHKPPARGVDKPNLFRSPGQWGRFLTELPWPRSLSEVATFA